MYINMITESIWTAALVIQEATDHDMDYARNFLEMGFCQKIFEVIDILGEEVYEEHFDDLTTMISYALSALVFGV